VSECVSLSFTLRYSSVFNIIIACLLQCCLLFFIRSCPVSKCNLKANECFKFFYVFFFSCPSSFPFPSELLCPSEAPCPSSWTSETFSLLRLTRSLRKNRPGNSSAFSCSFSLVFLFFFLFRIFFLLFCTFLVDYC